MRSPQSFIKSTVKGLGEWSKPKGWPRGWEVASTNKLPRIKGDVICQRYGKN